MEKRPVFGHNNGHKWLSRRVREGSVILGLEKVEQMIDVNVFHSGTANRNGNIIANGGRVLGITATGKSLKRLKG